MLAKDPWTELRISECLQLDQESETKQGIDGCCVCPTIPGMVVDPGERRRARDAREGRAGGREGERGRGRGGERGRGRGLRREGLGRSGCVGEGGKRW